ncbi:MAG: biotin transporter BioY [Rickettsia sp.]|nr:biotin transporter BioY [Rickettsia sp.]
MQTFHSEIYSFIKKNNLITIISFYICLNISSKIRIEYGLVPITFQTIALMGIGYCTRLKESLIIVLMHIALDRFPLLVAMSPSTGYLLGFVPFICSIQLVKHYMPKEKFFSQFIMLLVSNLVLFSIAVAFLRIFYIPSIKLALYEGALKFIPTACYKAIAVLFCFKLNSLLFTKQR